MGLFYFGNLGGLNDSQQNILNEFCASRMYVVIGTANQQSGVRLSALNTLSGSDLSKFYFATDINSQKVNNLRSQPACEIMITDGRDQVIIEGRINISSDRITKEKFWQEWMVGYFPGGIDDEKLCILEFTSENIRAMIE